MKGTTMSESPRAYYEALLELVSVAKGRWRTRDLCLFAAQRGANYSGGLLVVGRATNGWRDLFRADALTTSEGRENVTAMTFAVDSNEPDPMAWVTRQWSGSEFRYKTGMSAFWRVVRSTVMALRLATPDDDRWASSVAWTNLYKVAPEDSNPSDSLANAQLPSCIDILRAEIDQLEPQRVLFLTGEDWARPFLESLKVTPTAILPSLPVEVAGRIKGGPRVVVTPHPQSRVEAPFAREITRAFTAEDAGLGN